MSASETKIAATAAAETGSLTSRRAAALADRILEGASGLAEFAESLTDAEWATPVSDTDRRPIGIIVHHVASVYPAEVQIARAVAGGNAVTDINWDFIANMNADHAAENTGASKSETIELLRRNSREAADAVRTFTDEELEGAAPFALSFGAPVTAQFVIEDHALRHSWHHLARIRRTLGR